VALLADAIRGATFKTIALYLGLGIMVALGGMWFAWLLTRRITSPLKSLSEAAERMGAGDLETPIAANSGWTDIDLLASQLDDSRRNLQQIQGIARRQLRHIVHLLAATREGILSLDDDGMIAWANADAGRLLGYDNRELLRKHYMKIFRPLAGEMVDINDILNPAVGKPPPDRLTILNGQGSFTTLAVSCVSMDIDTAEGGRKRGERVLILREVGEDQALNRLRSEFLANVAHEFRTPLSSIAASTELMLDEGDEMQAGEVTYLAHRINLSVIHLQHLVNNLLESAIIEAGVFRLRMQSLCLRDLLHEVVEMMLPLIQRREQRLDLIVPNEGQLAICADADRLKQALVNLIENASKFSPSNTSMILSVSQDTDMLTFSVSDCGPGLPTERFESLFTRFFVGKNQGSAQYGIGLGLPIVKAIAEAHGGQVGAMNRHEGGAKVWFTIPLKQSVVQESNDKDLGG
jgi:signal transduction histidine kinase